LSLAFLGDGFGYRGIEIFDRRLCVEHGYSAWKFDEGGGERPGYYLLKATDGTVVLPTEALINSVCLHE
jgi:hypothetical protein